MVTTSPPLATYDLTASTPISSAAITGRSHMFVKAIPPSATARASSPAYARKLGADQTCTGDWSRFQHIVTNRTTNGSDITWGWEVAQDEAEERELVDRVVDLRGAVERADHARGLPPPPVIRRPPRLRDLGGRAVEAGYPQPLPEAGGAHPVEVHELEHALQVGREADEQGRADAGGGRRSGARGTRSAPYRIRAPRLPLTARAGTSANDRL